MQIPVQVGQSNVQINKYGLSISMELKRSLTERQIVWDNNPYEYIIAEEKAGALGSSGRRLELALKRLAAFEQTLPPVPNRSRQESAARELLVAEATERLYFYVVHREACGLFEHSIAYDTWDIPQEVRRGMGRRRNFHHAI